MKNWNFTHESSEALSTESITIMMQFYSFLQQKYSMNKRLGIHFGCILDSMILDENAFNRKW